MAPRVDLNPLNAANEDSMAWLEALVWPEHEDRRLRLTAAISMARQDHRHWLPAI